MLYESHKKNKSVLDRVDIDSEAPLVIHIINVPKSNPSQRFFLALSKSLTPEVEESGGQMRCLYIAVSSLLADSAFSRGLSVERTLAPVLPAPLDSQPTPTLTPLTLGNKSSSLNMIGEEEREHQCKECGLRLSTRSALTAHTRSHRVAADAHRCDVCHKTFAVPARLVRHYRTHTGERPFECEYCHKMFSVKENLQVHRRIHTKERPYRCAVCGAAFEHSGKLHRHARIHTGERPHACPHCHKTFIQSGQLVIHLRTHTGEKPYRCPAPGCGKGFTCSKQLKVHSRTHTGERPYTCEICLRDFGYNHVLKLHRFQHFGERCYRCTVCDGTFNTKKQMEAHIYKEHGAETPRAPAATQYTVPLVKGNVMCDIVEAALQQLPPTPPSSPPSPPCPIPASMPTTSTPPPFTSPLPSPSPPTVNTSMTVMTLAPSSLPPRKRKIIPQVESVYVEPIVRHTSVIQFAPPATDSS